MIKTIVAVLFVIPIAVEFAYYAQDFIQNHTMVQDLDLENFDRWPEEWMKEQAIHDFKGKDGEYENPHIDGKEYIL